MSEMKIVPFDDLKIKSEYYTYISTSDIKIAGKMFSAAREFAE